jgi:hypothetical protein
MDACSICPRRAQCAASSARSRSLNPARLGADGSRLCQPRSCTMPATRGALSIKKGRPQNCSVHAGATRADTPTGLFEAAIGVGVTAISAVIAGEMTWVEVARAATARGNRAIGALSAIRVRRTFGVHTSTAVARAIAQTRCTLHAPPSKPSDANKDRCNAFARNDNREGGMTRVLQDIRSSGSSKTAKIGPNFEPISRARSQGLKLAHGASAGGTQAGLSMARRAPRPSSP